MKKFLLLIFFNFIFSIHIVYPFLCCVSENDQIEDMKEKLNRATPIIINPTVRKTEILARYKTRNEDNITWYAHIYSPPPACINLSPQSQLTGVDDPSNYLIWYEWKIESKKPGFAEIRLEQYKNAHLQRTQFVKVEVTS